MFYVIYLDFYNSRQIGGKIWYNANAVLSTNCDINIALNESTRTYFFTKVYHNKFLSYYKTIFSLYNL